VDDTTFTRPLIKALVRHVDAFENDLVAQAERDTGARLSTSDQARLRPCAVSWVYYSVLVAWAADHQLIAPWWDKRGADTVRELGLSPREHLEAAYGCLIVHPATQCLGDARYSHLADGRPSDAVCADLIEWWRVDAPCLSWPDPDTGPSSISGWMAGDLLQALSAERRKAFAFAQTPWWVADFLIDRTLIPAAAEFREPVLRTVDPACGTGHVLIRKVDYLWELYTTGSLAPRQGKGGPRVDGYPVLDPGEAARRILAGVHGMEIDPLTAAVARLRMLVFVGHLLRQAGVLPTLTLRALPPTLRPVVGVGDSLLWGVATPAQYAKLHPRLAELQPSPDPGGDQEQLPVKP
jgi:hypothetical protein